MMDDTTALQLARDAESGSTTYFDANIRPNLERDIRQLRAGISQQQAVGDLLQSLYQRLVGPVESQLTKPRLTIVAHGALHYLPFNALMRGNQYLGDRFAIRTRQLFGQLRFRIGFKSLRHALPDQQQREHAAQRRSWILAEASMGSDADERAYRKALFENDTATLERLRAEAAARVERAKELLDA